MKYRCYNPKSDEYQYYGERGIKICKLWISDFGEFYRWSINNGYSDDLTIDRIDVNGNYEPSNCRWTTMKIQENNKRNNRILELEGRRQTVSQWSDEIGISRETLYKRLRSGLSDRDTLLRPIDQRKSR